jgi:hypothetical protein
VKPLGLPAGSVRAIAFLLIVGATVILTAYVVIRGDKELVPVLAALYGLCGGVIPAYFQSRKENEA